MKLFSILDFGFSIGRPKSKRIICLVLSALVLAVSFSAHAQQSTKVPRIGYLTGSSVAAVSENIEALLHGLRDLGYVEGKTIVIGWRGADGNRDRQRALAAELVRLKVDVIVASSGGDTRAAKEASGTIPIVMAQADDPVASGFVASLSQPGGNITGLSQFSPELSGKRLELLKEVVPKLSRVAVFGTSSSPGNAPVLNETRLAPVALGVSVQYVDVLSSKDFDTAFRSAVKLGADAVLWQVAGGVANPHRTQILELAVKSRLPAIYHNSAYVDAGGLMTYSLSATDLDRHVATYVDKILKGAKPADLPVQQPTKFELVINLKTAKQLGLTIPQKVLAQADKVIK